mmetsp:Transcript_53375/g.141716  ORF Transcript_53375/g.141716 Transcript_53375/m.141716 type:complete len:200 (+) Transcript_53375:114-713(+)
MFVALARCPREKFWYPARVWDSKRLFRGAGRANSSSFFSPPLRKQRAHSPPSIFRCLARDARSRTCYGRTFLSRGVFSCPSGPGLQRRVPWAPGRALSGVAILSPPTLCGAARCGGCALALSAGNSAARADDDACGPCAGAPPPLPPRRAQSPRFPAARAEAHRQRGAVDVAAALAAPRAGSISCHQSRGFDPWRLNMA